MVETVCKKCKKKYTFTPQERLDDQGNITIGLACPHCRDFTAVSKITQRGVVLQREVENLRKTGGHRVHGQLFDDKIKEFQQEVIRL